MITRFSIVTLVIFILSIIVVIYPVTLPIPLHGRRKRLRVPINLTTAPILAIAILWASQCLGPSQIRNGIVGTGGIKPYNILILFCSLAYMAITLDITGILKAAAFWVRNKGGSKGRRLYFYFYVMLTFFSVLMGNDPVILSGTVFLVYFTVVANIEPIPWLISEFASANTASMVLVVGNPTNVVVCEGFSINNAAFSLYTILPFLACNVACYAALAFQFRHGKHVSKVLPATAELNPREMLVDPVGACVGSLLFGSCIVVIMVVSFFHVDVWKISLPFAVAKLIFDFIWDYFRYTTGRFKRDEAGEPDGSATVSDDPMESQLKRAMSMPNGIDRQTTFASINPTLDAIPEKPNPDSTESSQTLTPPKPTRFNSQRLYLATLHTALSHRFPTFFTALPRLPFALVPFAFSQFILIEALDHQGWINVFADWLVRASHRQIYPTLWIMGVLGVIMCNLAGTNIGAVILLTKVVRAAPDFPDNSTRAAGIALAVASNIGAVSFTFSASLAGLLWRSILEQKGIHIKQSTFAFWNILPITVMTAVGLAVVSAEMAVLY